MSASGLAAHPSPAELGQRYRAARSPIERSQLQIVWLLSRGRSEREVAQVTGYGRRWVGEVARRYDEGGPDRPGRPAARERGRQAAAGGRGRGGAAGRASRAARRRRAVDGAEGGDVDGGPARPPGPAATRLGLPREARLQRPAAPAAARRGGEPGGAGGVQKSWPPRWTSTAR